MMRQVYLVTRYGYRSIFSRLNTLGKAYKLPSQLAQITTGTISYSPQPGHQQLSTITTNTIPNMSADTATI